MLKKLGIVLLAPFMFLFWMGTVAFDLSDDLQK
jgi:hypothetical protein